MFVPDPILQAVARFQKKFVANHDALVWQMINKAGGEITGF